MNYTYKLSVYHKLLDNSNQTTTIWQPNISKDNISKDNISKVSISEYNSVKDNSCGQLGWLSCLELLVFFD